jgi:hypothetical protein
MADWRGLQEFQPVQQWLQPSPDKPRLGFSCSRNRLAPVILVADKRLEGNL